MNAALSRKRWGGGGLLLLLLLALLMAAPLLRHRGLDHPLVATQRSDLCPLLPPPPRVLQYPRAAPLGGSAAAGSATCFYYDEEDQAVLSVTLSSTRQLSQGEPANTEKMFDTWIKEVRASYGSGVILPGESGEWRHAGSWKSGKQESLMFEDGGVLVLLESRQLDAKALADYARLVQQALRKPESD